MAMTVGTIFPPGARVDPNVLQSPLSSLSRLYPQMYLVSVVDRANEEKSSGYGSLYVTASSVMIWFPADTDGTEQKNQQNGENNCLLLHN